MYMVVYREDCTALDGNRLRHLRSAQVRIDGPVRLGVLLRPETAVVGWYWHGKSYNTVVRREPTRAGRLWLCPTCGHRAFNVLVAPPNTVGCKHCLRVKYRQWDRPARAREPRTPHLWEKWAAGRLKRMARRHKVKLEEPNDYGHPKTGD